MNDLSKRLKQIRKHFDWLQPDLAQALKASIDRIRSLETDRIKKLKDSEIMILTCDYNISHTWLLMGIGKMFEEELKNNDESVIYEVMLAVDEWLQENSYTLSPDKKVLLIQKITEFYQGNAEKVEKLTIKKYAIPLILKFVS